MWISKIRPFFRWLTFGIFILCKISLQAQPGVLVGDTVITQEKDRKVTTIRSGNSISIERTKNGKKDGVQESYYNGKIIIRRESWKNGFEDGEFLYWDYSGKIRERKTYLYVPDSGRSFLNGRSENYYNGGLQIQSQYRLGKLDGLQTEYYDRGKLKSRKEYKDGLLNGIEEYYFNNGQLGYKGTNKIIVKNGAKVSVKEGEWKHFLQNGKLSAVHNYKDGLKEGRNLEYYPEGGLREDAEYKQNKKFGKSKYWGLNGMLEAECVFYEEIEIDGKKMTNVFDGNRLQYYPNGNLKSKEMYIMGEKNGVWENYSNEGKLTFRVEYKQGVKIGKEQSFDAEGNLTVEVGYGPCTKDSVLVSCKQGVQRTWRKGVLTSETIFVDDREQGVRKGWFEDGKPMAVYEVSDGYFSGPYEEYWKNGKLKEKGQYVKLNGAGRKQSHVGWRFHYNEEGLLVAKSLYDTLDEAKVVINYSGNNIVSFDFYRNFSITSFPDSGVKSMVFNSYYGMPYFGVYYYRNGAQRKVIYPDPENYVVNVLYFDDRGKFVGSASTAHENADSVQSSFQVVKQVLSSLDPNWRSNKIFSDSVLNGSYQFLYANGKPMARISFANDLPHGEWMLLDPLNGDTASYKFFDQGVQTGYYVDKFAGKTLLDRGWFPKDSLPGYEELYSIRGVPTRKRMYRNNNNFPEENYEYFEDGSLKSFQNYKTGEYKFYSLNGNLLTETRMMADSLSQNLEYYAETNQLHYERYYRNTKQDSVSKAWFKNGKPQYIVNYRKGVREGWSLSYNENGDTISYGEYINDKAEGWFTEYKDGKKQFSYYVNGKRAAQPGNFECACVDTSYSAGNIRFAQTVSSLAEYEEMQNYLAPWIQPFDSLNYESIFFTGFQADGGRDQSFAAMNLMMFDELAIDVPASKKMRIAFNPCRTKGYISRMNVSLSYSNDPSETYMTLEPKRIALSLLSGPAMSLVKEYPYPTMLVKTNSVTYDYDNKIKIEEPTTPEHCLTSVLVNGIMKINQMQGGYKLFEIDNYFFAGTMINEGTVKHQELDDFFGFFVNKGAVSLSFKWNDSEVKLNAEVRNLLMCSKYSAGCISLPLQLNNADVLEVLGVNEEPVPVSVIEAAFKKADFRRVKSVKDTKSNSVLIYWFAE